jgi:chitin synthase
VYLIVEVTTNQETLPIISLVMIGAVYGLQALVFILRRKWDMVGWMVFYILAIPIFSLMLPLYSFWRMDDFSWGATRVVLGESGKKIIVHVCISGPLLLESMLMNFLQDEGKFDPRAIPLKSWNDYVRDFGPL